MEDVLSLGINFNVIEILKSNGDSIFKRKVNRKIVQFDIFNEFPTSL